MAREGRSADLRKGSLEHATERRRSLLERSRARHSRGAEAPIDGDSGTAFSHVSGGSLPDSDLPRVVSGLRLDPVEGDRGGLVDITCISWKPCPIERKPEARLLGNDDVPFLDDFSQGLDGGTWWVGRSGTGPTVAVADGRLELGVPSGSAPDPGQDWISANIQTRCKISGDFDVQVDFHLLQWPSANGVHVDLAVADERALVRLNTGREEIVAWFPRQTSSIAHDELSGSYRIRRTGSWIYGYVLGEGGWYELGRGRLFGRDAFARLGVGASAKEFSQQPVLIAFDNFRISSGRLVCP